MLAVIFVSPSSNAVAKPSLFILAIVSFDDFQVTSSVISREAPSEYTPSALNCNVVPLGIFPEEGVKLIEIHLASVTPNLAVFEVTPLKIAVISLLPLFKAFANPYVPFALLILAVVSFDDFQVTSSVIVRLLSSE